jgi:hypothetical protein
VLLAVGLLLVVMSSVFQALDPARGAFRAEPDTADVQQRLRVAADVLFDDLRGAGAGLSQGPGAGPLTDFALPVLPSRRGRRNADAPGTFKPDTITLLTVEPGAAQTTIAEALPARAATVRLNSDPGCPPGDPSCGFAAGMAVVVFDGTGAYDTFSVTSIDALGLHLQHDMPDASRVYGADVTHMAAATSRTYYLKADVATDTFQLMRYDGAGAADAPVVDHVVGLSFRYFGDPRPPTVIKSLGDPVGPWTTYGPTPSAAGESCLFAGSGTPIPAPLLPVLGDGSSLVPLGGALLSDGPWCPDSDSPNRFDADLLRIRRVSVTLRVESASAPLRGPAGPLFTRGGTASNAHGFVPDQEVRFDVSPLNLNLAR